MVGRSWCMAWCSPTDNGRRRRTTDPCGALAGAHVIGSADRCCFGSGADRRLSAGRHSTSGADVDLHSEVSHRGADAAPHGFDDRGEPVSLRGPPAHRLSAAGTPVNLLGGLGPTIGAIALTLPRLAAAFLVPVTNTHLTLPTICSV